MEDKCKNKLRNLWEKYKYLILWLFVVVIFWIIYWVSVEYGIDDNFGDASDRGIFGDQFGGLNALFSGFAFAVIIYTLILQRADLELQQEELKLTRDELKGQKEQMEMQTKTLTKQNFEDTFFRLLSFHNEVVDSLNMQNQQGKDFKKGRSSFEWFVNKINKNFKEEGDLFINIEKTFFDLNVEFCSYFSSYENIVEFVDTQNVGGLNYIKFLQGQMSMSEKLVLCYYGYVYKKSFKNYIENYSLLKGLDKNKWIQCDELKTYYEESAYDE